MPSDLKKYKGEIIEFTKGKEIGSGGNGKVFNIVCSNKQLQGLVAKFFCTERNKDIRYERFKNEIQTVLSIQDSIDGIMKILDYHCPDSVTECEDAFYIMKRGCRFRPRNVENILNCFLILANTLKQIHYKDYAHRDIKPDNILFIDNSPVLCDFGLIWDAKIPANERLSYDNERIGPKYIKPPELESINIGADIDYKKSDVYLLAKCLWIFLKDDWLGFRGQYTRSSVYYLNRNQYNVRTLEPIHRLMEKATVDDFRNRCSIEYVIEQLELQLKIIKQECHKELEDLLLLEEITNEFRINNEPNIVVFNEIKAVELLKAILPFQSITIKNYSDEVEDIVLEAGGRLLIKEDDYSIVYKRDNIVIKEYRLCINGLEYRDDTIIITLKSFEMLQEKNQEMYSTCHNLGSDSYLLIKS